MTKEPFSTRFSMRPVIPSTFTRALFSGSRSHAAMLVTPAQITAVETGHGKFRFVRSSERSRWMRDSSHSTSLLVVPTTLRPEPLREAISASPTRPSQPTIRVTGDLRSMFLHRGTRSRYTRRESIWVCCSHRVIGHSRLAWVCAAGPEVSTQLSWRRAQRLVKTEVVIASPPQVS